MKAQQLRNAVLQLAVQGKLVPQDPMDEPSSVLLEKIKIEKEKLIKDKKIKREKLPPEITEEEKPFYLPESWEWVRIGNLGIIQTGATPDTTEQSYFGTYIPFVKPGDITPTSINYFNEGLSRLGIVKGRLVKEKSILMVCIGGSTGKCYFTDRDVSCNQQINSMTPFSNIDYTYLFRCMTSNFFYKSVIEKATGTATPIVNKSNWSSIVIPLPPLAEQEYIVRKLEEIMPLIDQYEKFEIELSELEYNFPKNLKKSILQYAVEGKLVEQNKDDEPAILLFKRIKAEKEQLIKDKVIKRDKPLPEIIAEEKPFGIPANWEWVRLGEIFEVGTGVTPLKSENKYYDKGNIPWITSSLTSSAFINNTDTYVTKYALEHTSLKLYGKGTLILAMYGQGKTRGQISQLNMDATINQACAALKSIYINRILICYIKLFLKYNYDNSRKGAEGSAQPNLNLTKVKTILIPLPPLEEQQRIVSKVDQLMLLCDVLSDEKELNTYMLIPKKSKFIEFERQHPQKDEEYVENFNMVARAEKVSPETQAKMAERIKILRSKK